MFLHFSSDLQTFSSVCCVMPPTSLNLKHLRAVYSMSLIHNHIQIHIIQKEKTFFMLYLIGLSLLSIILKHSGAFRSDDIRCWGEVLLVVLLSSQWAGYLCNVDFTHSLVYCATVSVESAIYHSPCFWEVALKILSSFTNPYVVWLSFICWTQKEMFSKMSKLLFFHTLTIDGDQFRHSA